MPPPARKVGPQGYHLNPSVSVSLELEVTALKRLDHWVLNALPHSHLGNNFFSCVLYIPPEYRFISVRNMGNLLILGFRKHS